MKITYMFATSDPAETARVAAAERARFTAGKVRVAWSQMRGGVAIFVRGRMEGDLFDNEDEAREWLRDTHGIEVA
jgi:hypothetical protein